MILKSNCILCDCVDFAILYFTTKKEEVGILFMNLNWEKKFIFWDIYNTRNYNKKGIIEAFPPLRASSSVILPMLCERKMPERIDVLLWYARAKRRPSCSGAPTENSLQQKHDRNKFYPVHLAMADGTYCILFFWGRNLNCRIDRKSNLIAITSVGGTLFPL